MAETPLIPLQDGEQYRFHFDMGKCIGCKCCEVACHEQNNNPAAVKWREVGELEGGSFPTTARLYVSMACNHCLEPTCLSGCPTDAYYKDPTTGAVRMREESCIGCGYCTWNCPYEAPQFNPERNIVTKCDFCHNRLTQGLQPACVASCPSGALQVEAVHQKEWLEDFSEANAPGVPDAALTVSTTRMSLPKKITAVLSRSDHYRLKPEKPHFSLNGMTVLTQISVGAFLSLFFIEIAAELAELSFMLQKFLKMAPVAVLGIATMALTTSVFHLGRPLFAFRALKMVKRSWLSREILFFSLFALLAGPYAALRWHGPLVGSQLLMGLGLLIAVMGMAGIYCSAKIYMVPARPSWNTVRTPIAFFATALFLGPLTILFLMTLQTPSLSLSLLSNGSGLVIQGLAGVTVGAALLQLSAILIKFFHILNEEEPELRGTAQLLSQRFRTAFLLRMGCLAFAMVGVPLSLLGLAPPGESALLPRCLGAFLVIGLAGEFIGRHLFYVTVVSKKRPEGYFA